LFVTRNAILAVEGCGKAKESLFLGAARAARQIGAARAKRERRA